MALKGCFYVGVTLCESNIFGARGPFFGMGACHLFPQVVLALVLIKGVFGGVVTRAFSGCGGEASSLFHSCHSPFRGRVCSPVVGVEAPRSSFKLWCE